MKKKANIYDADDVERSKRLNFTPEERAARAEHKAEVLGTKLEKAKKKVPKKKKLRLSKSFAKKDIPFCRLALPVKKYFARKHRWQLSFILQPFCHNMILSTMPSEGPRMEQESGKQCLCIDKPAC